ncbi:MAG: YibE/F family protein, partial [Kiritimatiellia bacterium]
MPSYAIPLLTLALVLTVSLLLIGRDQGVRCLLMLVLFPALLFVAGWLIACHRAPVLPTLLVAGLLALAGQVFLLLGTGASGRLALLGAAGGYLSAVLMAGVCIPCFHITGVYSPLLRDLWYAPGTGQIDFASLALGAIALAGVGIIADLAVAVTATMQEVHQANRKLSSSQLFASGMRFGRDVIGTEINTLPFALLGSGIGGVLLILVKPDVAHWPFSWMTLVNQQSIAVEIAALSAGTIGLALTIPLTALLASKHLGSVVPAGEPQSVAAVRGRSALRRVSPGLLLVVAALITVAAYRVVGQLTYRYPQGTQATQTRLVRGQVVSVAEPGAPGASAGQRRANETLQTLQVRASDGKTWSAENAITGSPVNDRLPAPGDRVIIRLQEAGGERYAALSEFERDRGLLVLLLIVCVAVVLVSGWMGWRALAALAASLGIIGVFLLLLVRTRAMPLPLTIGCVFVVTAVTYLILFGWGRKAAGACLGVVLGLSVAAGAGLLFGQWLGLSGRYDGDLMALAFYSSAQGFDFPALLGAAILIGALGVAMDVSIAVASAVAEVQRADPQSGFRTLLAAGLSVGRKVIVAMFGAIFFAYIGLNIGL